MLNRLLHNVLFLILLFAWRHNCISQIITTVAGTGVAGFSGDGGLATAAKLNNPAYVILDSIGNIYVADTKNNCVRRIDTNGIIATVAGDGSAGYSGDGGPATSAKLYWTDGLAFDKHGDLFIADWNNMRVRKVTLSTGVITTVAGNGSAGYSGDGGLAISAKLYNPTAVQFDNAGNMYIADYSNNRIRKVDTNGIISTFAGTGVGGFSGDGGLAINAKLSEPSDIAFDNYGNSYITDSYNSRVRMVDTSGIITTIAGGGSGGLGDGGPAINANLFLASSSIFDISGNLYIADTHNRLIRKIDTTGIITSIAGNGTQGFSGDGGLATNAELSYPESIALDKFGNLYIADAYNHCIRKVTNVAQADVKKLQMKTLG